MSQKVKGGGGSDTQKCRDEPLTDTDRTRNNSSTPVFTSELTNVVLTWSRCVCGVMGHTPLTRPFSKWEDRDKLGFLGYLS